MTILDKIVAETRDVVASRKEKRSARDLEDSMFFQAPTLKLEESLSGPDLSFIAEIKKASPSQGVIRTDYNVPEIARAYKHNRAAAVSVLTEPVFFQGSLDHLEAARREIDLPLLRKDFIIDFYQLYEARAFGADAVLLIAAILDRVHLAELHAAAEELGLSCLVEVYELDELDRIDFDQVRILGVNNRDLKTFEVDIERSLRVFAAAPNGVLRVSESGIRTASDLAHLRLNGVDAVLIGEAFMRERDPGEALGRLDGEVREIIEQINERKKAS